MAVARSKEGPSKGPSDPPREGAGGRSPLAQARLLTLAPSHFSEKARWALDRTGLPYREECSGPGFHLRAVKRVGARTMPVLITTQGTILRDSTDILHHADRDGELFPHPLAAEIEALERELDVLGPAVRDWSYSWAVHHPPLIRHVFDKRLGAGQRVALRLTLPVVCQQLRARFHLDRMSTDGWFDALTSLWDRFDGWLADGRPYLVGDRFTAADLTLAALGAPAVAAPEYGGQLIPLERRPAAVRAQTERLRATAIGQLILRLYRDERARVRPGPDARAVV
jgi:glutathione S-transferase